MIFFLLICASAVAFEMKPADFLPEKYPYEQTEEVLPGYSEVPYTEAVVEPTPSAEEKESKMILFSRPLTEPIWPSSKPRTFERVDKLSAWGSPGQFVSVNFAVYPLEPLTKLKVRLSPGLDGEIKRVGYWKNCYPYYNSKDKKYRSMPEFLMPLNVCDAPAKEPQRFVITFKIAENNQPSSLSGKIYVFHDGFEQAAVLPLSIKVLPIKLKRDPNKHYTAYSYDVRDQHSVFYKKHKNNESLLHETQLKEFRQMLDYGFTRPHHFPLRTDATKDHAFCVTHFQKTLVELEEAGFDMKQPIMISGAADYHFLRRHMGKDIEPHYLNVTDVPEAYYQEIDLKLKDFLDQTKKENWPTIFFNPVDEPGIGAANFLNALYGVFKKHNCTTVATSFPGPLRKSMDNLIDIYSDGRFTMPYSKATDGSKQEYWAYPNDVAYQIRDPLIMCKGGRMTYGFGFWKSGYHQLMPWIWRLPNNDSRIRGRGGNFQLPDGTVAVGIYWDCFREGIYDAMYLYTLQDAIVKRENNPDDKCRTLVERGRELIQCTWDDIPAQSQYLLEGVFPHEEFDSRRREFAVLIQELSAFPETNTKEAPSVIADTSKIPPDNSSREDLSFASAEVMPLENWLPQEDEAEVFKQDDCTLLKIKIDHKVDGTGSEEPKWLMGWPRMVKHFDNLDIGRFQYLTLQLQVNSDRDGESNYSWPMTAQIVIPKRDPLPLHQFKRLEPGAWHSIQIPLENHQDLKNQKVTSLYFFISESAYPDGCTLDFLFKDIRLVALKDPAFSDIECASQIDIANHFLPVSCRVIGPHDGNEKYSLCLTLKRSNGETVNQQFHPVTNNHHHAFDISTQLPGEYIVSLGLLKSRELISEAQRKIRLIHSFEIK